MKEFETVTINLNLRPKKTVFFIPTEERAFFEVVKLSTDRWGGIFHLIVPVDNGKIHQIFVSMLEELDPDTIIFYDEETKRILDRSIAKKLEEMNPFSFYLFKDTQNDSYLTSYIPDNPRDQISIPPLIKEMKELVGQEYSSEFALLWNNSLLRTANFLSADYIERTNFLTEFVLVITAGSGVEDYCLFWNLRVFFHTSESEDMRPMVLLLPRYVLEKDCQKLHKLLSDDLEKVKRSHVPQIALTSISLREEEIDNILNKSTGKSFIKSTKRQVQYEEAGKKSALEYLFVSELLSEKSKTYFNIFNTEFRSILLQFADNRAKLHFNFPSEYLYTFDSILELTGLQKFNLPVIPGIGKLFCSHTVPSEAMPDIKDVRLKASGLCFRLGILLEVLIPLRIPSPVEVFRKYFEHKGYSFETSNRTDPVKQIINFLDYYSSRIQDDFLSADVVKLFTEMTPPARRKFEKTFEKIWKKTDDQDLKEAVKSFLDDTNFFPSQKFKKFNDIKRLLRGKDDLIDVLVKNKLLLRGFLVTCNTCGLVSWYPLGSIGEEYTCSGCLNLNHTPVITKDGGLSIYYMLNKLQQKAMDQDFFPEIAAIMELKRSYKNKYSYYFPSCVIKSLSKESKVEEAELDGVFLSESGLIIIEAKKSGKVSEKEITEKIKLVDVLSSSKIIFYSYEGWEKTFRDKFAGKKNVEFLDFNTASNNGNNGHQK